MLTGVGDNTEIKEIESLALTLGEKKNCEKDYLQRIRKGRKEE